MRMSFSAEDAQWMRLAIEKASMGLGLTSPNPPVGAVIVHNGKVIGTGYHQGAGLPHAEREAINDAISGGNGPLLEGSTIYVTLEPCSTHGRTPPCTDGIREAGIKRVVFGVEDPNPSNKCLACDLLAEQGIRVEHGLLAEECGDLIKGFKTALLKHRPWIIAKTAMTLDGRITRDSRFKQWFTGKEAKNYVHTLRSLSDAVLVGGETVRRDDPALTIRTPDRPVSGLKKQPWRIILTMDRESLPGNSLCLTDQFNERTVVFERVKRFEDLLEVLVNQYDINILLLECGGKLLRRFLEMGLVDEWVGFYAPLINGGPETGVGPGKDFLESEAFLSKVTYKQYGEDLCVQGCVHYRLPS